MNGRMSLVIVAAGARRSKGTIKEAEELALVSKWIVKSINLARITLERIDPNDCHVLVSQPIF